MFTRQRLHIREKKRKIKSENRVMFARVEKASFLEPCIAMRKEREEKAKISFSVFARFSNNTKRRKILHNREQSKYHQS
jgi:hypothetical protein